MKRSTRSRITENIDDLIIITLASVLGAALLYFVTRSLAGEAGVGSPSVWPYALLALGMWVSCVVIDLIRPAHGPRMTRAAIRDGKLRIRTRILGLSRGTIDLTQARYLAWEASTFHREPRLAFYDQDPDLEMTFLGTKPTNPAAARLGTMDPRILADQGEVSAALQDLVNAGTLTTAVDLNTGDPLPHALPPLARGVEVHTDGTVLYRGSPPSESPDSDLAQGPTS